MRDYPNVEEHIKRREEELRYPYRHNDLNADIKGSGNNDNAMTNMLITIEQDRRLSVLERNKRVIDYNLEDCDDDTYKIIYELYINRYPKYTMQGLVDNRIVDCGKSKAFELRNAFFDNVADDLGMDK